MRGDLTSISRAKQWLLPSAAVATANTSDDLLGRLVTAASRFVMNYMNRDSLDVVVRDERYDTGAINMVVLRQFPVVSVQSVEYAGISVTKEATGNPPANGWEIFPGDGGGQQRLMVHGVPFPRGRSGVRVQYTSGCLIDETQTVSSGTVVLDYMWISDQGVTAAGTALDRVTGTPGAGEYTVSDAGVYAFHESLEGAVVVVSYSYVPADIEQAVIELVAERFKAKDRIGISSKTIPNGESISYNNRMVTDPIKQLLQNYCRVVPS